jgi:ABC-type branched-subunit amino acid transport system substrate-binding protein
MRLFALATTLAAAVAAVWAASSGSVQAQEPIKLGFAGALSGPASFVGVEIKRGAEIAVDEINAKGGVNGRKLMLVPRDDEGPRACSTHKSDNDPRMLFVGTSSSATSRNLKRLPLVASLNHALDS